MIGGKKFNHFHIWKKEGIIFGTFFFFAPKFIDLGFVLILRIISGTLRGSEIIKLLDIELTEFGVVVVGDLRTGLQDHIIEVVKLDILLRLI